MVPTRGRAPPAALRPAARRSWPAADARRVPGRVRQVHAARRLAGARGGRAPRGLGHARRRRRRRRRAVVARDRGALPRLPGAARARRWTRPAIAAAAARGRCSRGWSTSSPSSGDVVLDPRRRAPADERGGARRASPGSSTTRRRRRRSSSPRAPIPALPLGALRAHGELVEVRADDLRFTAGRGGRVPQRPARARASRRRGPRAARRAHGGLARRPLPRRALARGPRRTSRRWSTPSTAPAAHVVDFLSTEVLSAYDPELQRFMLRTSVLERLCADAVRRGARRRRRRATCSSGSRARNLFLLPLDDHRRWFRFHHLFAQLLRVELERREPGAARRRCTAARPRGTRASGTTDEAVHHALAAGAHDEAGALVAGRLGALRQRRPDVVGARLAGARSRARWLDADARAPARAGLGRRRCAAASTTCARAIGARARARPTSRPGRCRTASSSLGLEHQRAARRVRLGRRARDAARRARARRSAEDLGSPWRPVVSWSLGWGHYCAGDLDAAERWLTRDARSSPRPPSSGSWARARSPTSRCWPASAATAPSSCGSRSRRVDQAQRTGLLEACEVGEVHTALRVRAARPRPPRARRCPSSSRACSCAASGASRSTSLDGLIALAPAVAALGDRDARRGAVPTRPRSSLARCPDPGVLPERLARRPPGRARPPRRPGR